jgi:anti-anti-sigma regulatory factor
MKQCKSTPTVDPDVKSIIVDLKAFEDVDSGFLTFLMRLRQHARGAGYAVHLVGVTDRLRLVLNKTGLVRLFTYELAE